MMCEVCLCEFVDVDIVVNIFMFVELNYVDVFKRACMSFIVVNLSDVMLMEGYEVMNILCLYLVGEILSFVVEMCVLCLKVEVFSSAFVFA